MGDLISRSDNPLLTRSQQLRVMISMMDRENPDAVIKLICTRAAALDWMRGMELFEEAQRRVAPQVVARKGAAIPALAWFVSGLSIGIFLAAQVLQ